MSGSLFDHDKISIWPTQEVCMTLLYIGATCVGAQPQWGSLHTRVEACGLEKLDRNNRDMKRYRDIG